MDPYLIRRNIMAEEVEDSVTVVDVYDQAAGIGKEFEKLIESYGVDSVTDLMPKVIKALEQLETLAGKYERENSEIAELRYTIDKLENEKIERNQERIRYEQELEQIEENWRKEAKELYSVIGQLQEDNRRLRDNLSEQKEAVKEEVAAVTRETEQKEIEVLTKLKDTVDKQREELRKIKRESKQKEIDCEALQSQLEQVVKEEDDVTENGEKISTEIEAADDFNNPEDEGDIAKIEEKISMVGKMVIDMKDPNRPRFTLNELRTVLLERNELKAKLIEVEEELSSYKPNYSGEEDLPVQGPVNKEPFEKLYPGMKKESGIRKFFKFVFGSPAREEYPRRRSRDK
ncbi:hypothetical protein KUTeg_010194 [Tegillarca granosa]|uniref:RILP-like protein n=1 Tax=Tegillarca granosa TaxID=220873 RepID=A0ABQ9F9C6_TEGGR|nr:hypothetical protein KUTeg_010194 [Tegillarca granosa]